MLEGAGIYIPPFKIARLKEELRDANDASGQRLEWERLRKSVKGLVNKVSSSNIKSIVQELLVENLSRGRGLFLRSIMHAQASAPIFTNVFAALVAVLNARFPDIGDLLVRRVVLQFRRAYSRSDEMLLTCICKFLAHLFNQRVVSEIVVLQVVTIFLEKLSSDSVKVCCQMLLECGQVMSEESPKGMFFIFERLRQVLQEGSIDKRVQYMIETLFEARRKKFESHPGLLPELDLVEEDDQVTHEVDVIEGDIEGEESLNLFQAQEPEIFAAENEKWRELSCEMLGVVPGEEIQEEEEGEASSEDKINPDHMEVKDMSEQELISLRKRIYLAIMSSANYEECVHKLLSLKIPQGQERIVVGMLVDSCGIEKTSNRFFHLQAERLCRLSRIYKQEFEAAFAHQYEAMHRYETNKIRNIAKMFSHLLASDCVDWSDVFKSVRLTEQDTNSSTRIFLKILFQDLNETMASTSLGEKIQDEKLSQGLSGIFPRSDDFQHIRFSINFFTAIGLGPLTGFLRQQLEEINAQKLPPIKRSPSPERSPPRQVRQRSLSRDSFGRARRKERRREEFKEEKTGGVPRDRRAQL